MLAQNNRSYQIPYVNTEPKRMGRPPSGKARRSIKVECNMTPEDGETLAEFAKNYGFRSRSAMLTAILERLVIGEFTGITFLKLGWQFSNLLEKQPGQGKMDFLGALRPLPPLIGDQDEPETAELVPFIEEVKNQMKEPTKC